MAKPRQKVSRRQLEALIAEAGGKCANPGCFVRQTELHHIKHWAVYASNDEEHMIALCPACHDAAHRGSIRLDDMTLYTWKKIVRKQTKHDYFAVEPGKSGILFLGQHAVKCVESTRVIDLSEGTSLEFRVDSKGFFLVSLSLQTVGGEPVIEIRDNRVTHSLSDLISYQSISGDLRVKIRQPAQYLPDWLIPVISNYKPTIPDLVPFASELANYVWNSFHPGFKALHMTVVAPSQVRVQGVFCTQECALMISPVGLVVATPKGTSGIFGGATFVGGPNGTLMTSASRKAYWSEKGRRFAFSLPN